MVEHADGFRYLRVDFPAEVDSSNSPAMRDQLFRLINVGAAGIILDLSNTHFFDSSGIQVIAQIHERAKAQRARVCAVVPEGGLVRRVFDLTAMQRLIAVVSDLTAARAFIITPRAEDA